MWENGENESGDGLRDLEDVTYSIINKTVLQGGERDESIIP